MCTVREKESVVGTTGGQQTLELMAWADTW